MKDIKNVNIEILSDDWKPLKKMIFDYRVNDNHWETITREVYDRGHGAVVLLYNLKKNTVVITEQFRAPAYINNKTDGLSLEACAGMLDKGDPESTIIREIEEETGYAITDVKKIYQAYSSPGAMTEMLYYFIASYTDKDKVSEGGGLDSEHENIIVHEIDFNEALHLLANGTIKDAKTIILLQYAQINLFNNPK